MGPYVVGFDTMAYYVSTTTLWLHGNVNLGSFIATAPLLYALIIGFVLSGGSVVLVLKVLPPVLLGFLGLAMYGYARRGLGWSPTKSIVPALVGTLYFVALRVSWDAFREELALIFFFVVLMLLVTKAGASEKKFSWKRYGAFALALAAVVLSNQVVAVLVLGVLLFTVVYKLVRESRIDAVHLILFSLPAVLLFFLIFYLSPSVPEYRLIFGFPTTTSDGWLALFGYSSYPAMLASEAGFFLYCFVPLLPLALLSVKLFSNFQMRSFIALVFVASLIPMVSPSDLRIVMLLVYPLAFFVTEGLSRLKSVHWKRFKITSLRVGLVYLMLVTVVLSLGFMVMTPASPFLYFKEGVNPYVYTIPTSMLQNTVSIADCQGTVNALQWLKDNMTGSSILLTHRAFYGWALTTFNPDQVFLYEFGNPLTAATTAAQEGYSRIYLIWWVNGKGWDGQPTVAPAFHEIYQSGEIAIYQYEA